MTRFEKLLAVFADTVKAGGGIHSNAELAFMMGEPLTTSFTKFLSDSVKKGIIRRVAQGVFESAITPPDPATAIYKTINKLRNNVLINNVFLGCGS